MSKIKTVYLVTDIVKKTEVAFDVLGEAISAYTELGAASLTEQKWVMSTSTVITQKEAQVVKPAAGPSSMQLAIEAAVQKAMGTSTPSEKKGLTIQDAHKCLKMLASGSFTQADVLQEFDIPSATLRALITGRHTKYPEVRKHYDLSNMKKGKGGKKQ